MKPYMGSASSSAHAAKRAEDHVKIFIAYNFFRKSARISYIISFFTYIPSNHLNHQSALGHASINRSENRCSRNAMLSVFE